jgi:two-component system, chemotaxis family, chemotaxis protein CheY
MCVYELTVARCLAAPSVLVSSENEVWVKVEKDLNKTGAGKTVLVVDDNPAIRKTLAGAFLSDSFKTCGEAENGKEAIELAQRIKPDVITLDLSMPVMNGVEAAPRLRKLFPNTPIILLTLYADDFLKASVSTLGVDLLLSKTESLITIIRKAHDLMGD